MQQYVLGFAFDEQTGKVAMIRKNRPSWQAGKLNGVGGKIEQGETPRQAMVREFREETGGVTKPDAWVHYSTMKGQDFNVLVYRTTVSSPRFVSLFSRTDERVVLIEPEKVVLQPYLDNIPLLLAAAQDPNCGRMLMTLEYMTEEELLSLDESR